MTYEIRLTRQAAKDIQRLSPKLRAKAAGILRNRIAVDPYSGKALTGSLKGCYSVRLTYQDRIVYRIHEGELVVIAIRARTHYGD